MSVFPKWNAILLQFSHRFEAHTLPFSVRFQLGLQHFTHIASTWKKQAQYFSYISQEEQWQKHPESVVHVHQVFLVWTNRPNLWS